MLRMPPPPIRAWWFYELIDVRSRFHTEEVVAGALAFFEKHPNWMGGFGLSPHAPYTASTTLYGLARFCCEKYSMPWTTHLAESEEEFDMFVRASGPLYDFLRDLGRGMHDVGGITPVARLFGDGAVPLGRHPGTYEQLGGFGLSASGNLRERHHRGPLPEMPRVFRTAPPLRLTDSAPSEFRYVLEPTVSRATHR